MYIGCYIPRWCIPGYIGCYIPGWGIPGGGVHRVYIPRGAYPGVYLGERYIPVYTTLP